MYKSVLLALIDALSQWQHSIIRNERVRLGDLKNDAIIALKKLICVTTCRMVGAVSVMMIY